VARGLTDKAGEPLSGLYTAVAGLVLLVANTVLVAGVLCLMREAPLHTAWRSIQLWAAPYYLAGGLLAHVWSQAPLTMLWVGVLAALSVYILSLSYRGAAAMCARTGA
jgi:hypothetical protein